MNKVSSTRTRLRSSRMQQQQAAALPRNLQQY